MNKLRDHRQRRSPHRNDIDLCQLAGCGSCYNAKKAELFVVKREIGCRHHRYGSFGTVVPIRKHCKSSILSVSGTFADGKRFLESVTARVGSSRGGFWGRGDRIVKSVTPLSKLQMRSKK
jgi:hypothetical protein